MKTQNFIFDQRKNNRIINKNPQGLVELLKEIESHQLENKIFGKIVDYSLGGWGLIVMTKVPPKVKDIYHLNLVQLSSESRLFRIQVKWGKKLDDETFRIGVQSLI